MFLCSFFSCSSLSALAFLPSRSILFSLTTRFMLFSLISNPLLNQHTYCPASGNTNLHCKRDLSWTYNFVILVHCSFWLHVGQTNIMPFLGNMIRFKERKVTSHVPNFQWLWLEVYADYHNEH